MQNNNKKFERVLQTTMPRALLRDAVNLAIGLKDDFAGKNATPIHLADALNWSPSSSGWRTLTGATVAYGLVDNAYGAKSISLTSLGEKVVKPTKDGDKEKGLMTALLRPTIPKAFYEKYDGAKFPKDDIAKNILNQLGVPQNRTDEALKIIIDNAKFVGVLSSAGGNKYIQLNVPIRANKEIEKNNIVESDSKLQEVNPNKNTGTNTFPFIDNEMAIILSENIQKKAWLSKELNEKVQGLMKAAQALADELNKKNGT